VAERPDEQKAKQGGSLILGKGGKKRQLGRKDASFPLPKKTAFPAVAQTRLAKERKKEEH